MTFFIMFIVPTTFVAIYERLYEKMKNSKRLQYFIWSVAIITFILSLIIAGFDIAVWAFNLEYYLKTPGTDENIFFLYIGLLLIAFLGDVVTVIIGMVVLHRTDSSIHAGNNKKWKKDFPIPSLIKCLSCMYFCCCPCSRNCKRHALIWIGSTFFVFFLQLSSFHIFYMALAAVASPVETVSHIIFYFASFFCLVAIVAFILKFTEKSGCDELCQNCGTPNNTGNAGGTPGNAGNTGGTPNNAGNTGGTPNNAGNTGGTPNNAGNTGGTPNNAGNTGGTPNNAGNTGGTPNNAGNTGGTPNNAGNTGGTPNNAGNTGGTPNNAGNTGGTPNNAGNTGGTPNNAGNTGGTPNNAGNTGGTPNNAGNTGGTPNNAGNTGGTPNNAGNTGGTPNNAGNTGGTPNNAGNTGGTPNNAGNTGGTPNNAGNTGGTPNNAGNTGGTPNNAGNTGGTPNDNRKQCATFLCNIAKFIPVVVSIFILAASFVMFGLFYFLFSVMIENYRNSGGILAILGVLIPSTLSILIGLSKTSLMGCIDVTKKDGVDGEQAEA